MAQSEDVEAAYRCAILRILKLIEIGVCFAHNTETILS